MGGGCLGGLIGALLGVALGGFIGSVATGSSHPVEVPKGAGAVETGAALVQPLFDGCGAFFAMLLGAGIGGIIGGIGGSVLGAVLAAKASSTLTEGSPSVKSSTHVPEPATESPDAELARLKGRVAELEAKKWKDDRFKEERSQGGT
jgi:hypothetical protein